MALKGRDALVLTDGFHSTDGDLESMCAINSNGSAIASNTPLLH